MKTRTHLSDEVKRELVRRYKAGEIAAELHKEFNLGKTSIFRWASDPRYNDPATTAPTQPAALPAKPKRSSYSKEFRNQVAARFNAGENAPALAKEFGVKADLIYNWAATLRKKGPNGKKPKTMQPVVLTAPMSVAVPMLNGADYCPCCGFPIAMVNKTVNAIKAQAPQ